jgi:NAD(P)-dependent dehydrogenase (short-subunit alcohol dehydrogenase family)
MSESKVVLITGCSNGFGRQLVEPLTRRGYRVYATMRHATGKNAGASAQLLLLASQGLPVRVLEMDMTSTEQVEAAVAQVIADAGRIDVVVHSAAVMPIGISEAYSVEHFQMHLETNVVGLHRLNRAVLPHMRRQGSGLMLHISSVVGRVIIPFMSLYNATKHAVEAYAEGLRYELSAFGVDSVIVQPGPFHTNLLAASPKADDTARVEEYGALSEIPQQLHAAFRQMFADDSMPTDPQMVVDAIVRLIEMPAGERPLRTTIGIDFGASRINEAVAPVQAEALAALGMAHMRDVGAARAHAVSAGAPA